jgi:amidophosphoribosyltransferase
MCAVVGVFDSVDAAKIAYYALFAMQHRGQEATGISTNNGEDIHLVKKRGLVTEVFDQNAFDVLKGDCAIGHNRYSTAGSESLKDAQPIVAGYDLGKISIVHNGNLINKNEVRNELIKSGAIFSTSMDTENLIHLIARSNKEKLRDRLVEALEKVKGAYNFIIQSRSKMFVIRDKHGIRPLSLGKLPDGGFIVASETCAFDLVGAKFVRDVNPGEMLIFEKGKEMLSWQLQEPDYRPCAFEYIYFSRPDSVIDGKSVYDIRQKMGAKLAQSMKNIDVDLVLPVPDSGVAAALGFAKESHAHFEMGIVRNHYVGRTFIEPTQELRDLKVKMKLSPIVSELKGKKIVIIDDSLVRGTTSKKIVKMLKDIGVAQVHMAIAAPEIKYPCYYGIDTPTKQELLSSSQTPKQIKDYIGADSLTFLSIEDLVDAIGRDRQYSLVSFDGNYFVK